MFSDKLLTFVISARLSCVHISTSTQSLYSLWFPRRHCVRRLDFRRFLESSLRSSREGGWARAHFPNSGWLSSLLCPALSYFNCTRYFSCVVQAFRVLKPLTLFVGESESYAGDMAVAATSPWLAVLSSTHSLWTSLALITAQSSCTHIFSLFQLFKCFHGRDLVFLCIVKTSS